MSYAQSLNTRLLGALASYGFDAAPHVEPVTQGVASPSRLSTEWAGFRVIGANGNCYVKVLQADMAQLIDVEQAAQASECAGRSGAAPRLLGADQTHGVLIFEDLGPQWRTARLDDLLAPGRLDALWALKRQVHAGPVPDFIRSPMADIERLRALCKRDGVALPAEHQWIDRCVDMVWQALQKCQIRSVPVHGDGVASNVMVSGDGQLRLVDFDYSGCMDPWYDVAITLNELYSFESEWRAGISAWAGQCLEVDYAVCRLYALINDWYWTLWGFWSGSTSSRPLEFSKVGQWTLLRCRQCVQDPRLEGWMRQIQEGRA
ncbi:aminoglycoside phosphotransferase family protein [Pseudomonas syringae pv. actinidifoliorum]|uniref:aminoglycoside phosphotransferase family protein n=1 Tax=Pseudomonas syringae TaxID=317 RepID=UPI00034AAFC4|nr:aminoglycoside phosphotransferase family protein [Pseudomonas syringae]NAS96105.1 aminoglycoside phosphotransferase family protein [Pseudomonas syringae pv. actinidifoliorum]NAT63215.1 aminoglycoside phosphotransferase family protein [Pseudomonas syringae pv. actinidifoliorum]